MSHTDDTNPNRGRPVLKRFEANEDTPASIAELANAGKLWIYCGQFADGSAERVATAAQNIHGSGTFKVFPSGSWPGGYLRD